MLQSVERVTFGIQNFHLSLLHDIYVPVSLEHGSTSPVGAVKMENSTSHSARETPKKDHFLERL